MSVTVTCPKHRAYSAQRMPRYNTHSRFYCQTCWHMWFLINGFRRAAKGYILRYNTTTK